MAALYRIYNAVYLLNKNWVNISFSDVDSKLLLESGATNSFAGILGVGDHGYNPMISAVGEQYQGSQSYIVTQFADDSREIIYPMPKWDERHWYHF